MFDRTKLATLFASHVPGRRLTYMQVSHGTGVDAAMLQRLVKKDGISPSQDTLERLAKFFYGDHRMISEFVDEQEPIDKMAVALVGAHSEPTITLAKRNGKSVK